MKTEIVVFPNPNQLIILRKIQKSLCDVPTLPLILKCTELHDLSDLISKAVPEGYYIEEKKLFIKVAMEINGKACEGSIELGKTNGFSQESSDINPETTSLLKMKKISPFRIVEMKSEEFQNGITWKIVREKWKKI